MFKSAGGSGKISRSMRSRITGQGFNCSPISLRLVFSDARNASRTGSIAVNATFNWTTSRGEILPTAALEMIRSKSPISESFSSSNRFNSGSRKKFSTTSSRFSMGLASLSGKTIHRRNMREPMGEMVLSSTSSKLFPPSFIVEISSRLRTVNLSRRT
ncbi:MAG: hypothetical protein BWZ00_01639 [Bacteroidetes bacterium ADurb.BinA174]|nr:MAG: hypothetical protein BWZ00_01639 [Bacteroidetes bacterium ADurb.BinA174]